MMACRRRNSKDLTQVVGDANEVADNLQRSLEKLRCPSPVEKTETGMLRSRIAEQSALICILKQGSEETLRRCQALQRANAELEERAAAGQRELDSGRKTAATLEGRFLDLASNHQEIIAFKDEYKRENAQLRLENERLRSENESIFSQKLQDKEVLIAQLTQETKLMAEKLKSMENERREKEAGLQLKLLEQTTLHRSKEESLVNELHEAQRQLRDVQHRLQTAEDLGNDLKRQLQKTTLEKDKFLTLSTEQGKLIQEKQGRQQQLETKLKEVEAAKAKAEDRFEQDASAVNSNLKVRSLQSALEDTMKKHEKLKEDFEAVKEHSAVLLSQERDLNTKLRHMIG